LQKHKGVQAAIRAGKDRSAAEVALGAAPARDLMPYKHARIGEKGKKETAKETAHTAAKKGKFKPTAAPSNVVQMRKTG
jgi:hypothetical protein